MALNLLSKLSPRYLEPVLRSKAGVKALKYGYKAYDLSSKLWNKVPPITVFRGVCQTHAHYYLAKEGIVIPRNLLGTTDIDVHNYGTSNSALTSWTRDKSVAETHAGQEGVILEVTVPGNRLGWSPDVWYEQEVLVRGLVCGAKIIPVKRPPHMPAVKPPPTDL